MNQVVATPVQAAEQTPKCCICRQDAPYKQFHVRLPWGKVVHFCEVDYAHVRQLLGYTAQIGRVFSARHKTQLGAPRR